MSEYFDMCDTYRAAGKWENNFSPLRINYDIFIFVLLLLMFIFDEGADWSHSKLCTKWSKEIAS